MCLVPPLVALLVRVPWVSCSNPGSPLVKCEEVFLLPAALTLPGAYVLTPQGGMGAAPPGGGGGSVWCRHWWQCGYAPVGLALVSWVCSREVQDSFFIWFGQGVDAAWPVGCHHTPKGAGGACPAMGQRLGLWGCYFMASPGSFFTSSASRRFEALFDPQG